ncbi:MAG: prolipoprotein diacylglyceryl transferase [Thermoanaerobaculia bacterium]|nr:prolipoprotein diacylglyceryl transferase [Thermoanaerobaculia bacterium]
MWPTLIKIGSFEITTFGLMMFAGFLVGAWLMTKEFRRLGVEEDLASNILIAAVIGGILGGKIYYAILYGDLSLVFSRAGLVWYGGLLGGFLAASIVVMRSRTDYLTAADGVAPGLAIGYALGRVGCFLVGDDYGKPTDSWVGIAFPEGAPPTTARSLRAFGVDLDPSIPGDAVLQVHPTQLYTAFSFFAFTAILLWISRNHYWRGRIWSLFLIFLGVERFLIEILRAKDDRFFGDFTLAQLISIVIVVIGAGLLIVRERARLRAAEAEV